VQLARQLYTARKSSTENFRLLTLSAVIFPRI